MDFMELYNFRWVVYCQMKNKSNNIDLMSIESMFLNSNFMYWKRFYDTFLISPKSKYFENLSNDLKMIHENNLLLLYDCTLPLPPQEPTFLFWSWIYWIDFHCL
jgi:hypothetical protein